MSEETQIETQEVEHIVYWDDGDEDTEQESLEDACND